VATRRLSSAVDQLDDHYEVVVVGSGYGGGIAASRLARAGRHVCLLEQGRELVPGESPRTALDAAREMQFDLPSQHLGRRTGLYHFRIGPGISAFDGCGLGGTSLVNANVALQADPRVFEDERWPAELRSDSDGALAMGYRRASEMLQPVPYPDRFPPLPKLTALERSADAFADERFYRPPINVTFTSGINAAGIPQQECILCGDCVSGCDYEAKNTTLMNYLPDAKAHGAQIFCGVAVHHVEHRDGRWLVYYDILETGRERFRAPEQFLTADLVVLAAGTFGSTEILLRSGQAGLPLSPTVGRRFSGNGDVLGFAYDAAVDIDGIGMGDRGAHSRPLAGHTGHCGPCITGIIDLRETPVLADGVVIEDGSIPGALSVFLPEVLGAAATAVGVEPKSRGRFHEFVDTLDSVIFGPEAGAINRTQTFLVMSHDTADGRLHLSDDDRVQIDWPGVGDEPVFGEVAEKLAKAAGAIDATYLRDPVSSRYLNNELITVHPLGGACLAADGASGVVDERHRAFTGPGAAVHEGLYVADGSVIPMALGVNPLLTISALAERCCQLIAADHGWTIDYDLPQGPIEIHTEPRPTGIEFTETMHGTMTAAPAPADAASPGDADDHSRCEFVVTVVAVDARRFLDDPDHKAALGGSVTIRAVDAAPMTVDRGTFNLFIQDPDHVDTRLMIYEMPLVSATGKRYFFYGEKVVHHDRPFDLWHDTTTLTAELHDGENRDAPVVAAGTLELSPEDLRRQLGTMRAVDAPSREEALETIAEFGRFFAGVLWDTYGGGLRDPQRFDDRAPPRKKRPLRAPAPSVFALKAKDGTPLRLTRYHGGDKGPALLIHGLGVSSLIFTIDTVRTNLVEFLVAHGYDVWLLDYRASIALEASHTRSNGDTVATDDIPTAVADVLARTGRPSIQVVAHCYGATTFTMAMLAGLRGVRSAVISQISTDIRVGTLTNLKAGLHIANLLDELGVDSLTALSERDESWHERLYDRALGLLSPGFAGQECDSATCHRISFMYAPLYEHARLNEATHQALNEMFGVANIGAFEHLQTMVKHKMVVDTRGGDVYVSHADRFAIPTLFIHGENNRCYLPESTALTVDRLSTVNDPALYDRQVIPGYGHIDCIFGKDADRDVYPLMLAHLDANPG